MLDIVLMFYHSLRYKRKTSAFFARNKCKTIGYIYNGETSIAKITWRQDIAKLQQSNDIVDVAVYTRIHARILKYVK